MKTQMRWNEEVEDAIVKVAELRNRTAQPIEGPVDTNEIRDVLRQLETDSDVDEHEYRAIFHVYKYCKEHFNI